MILVSAKTIAMVADLMLCQLILVKMYSYFLYANQELICDQIPKESNMMSFAERSVEIIGNGK